MTTAPDPRVPPPGLTVGGYAIRARLGEGGMGVVHLAQRPGERPIALKVLRPHVVGDEEARRRLAREVGSLSRVRSRRVAEILDADPWGDIPYVATRYVPGLSVHDHVHEEGPIVGDDLIWFASCLAEALEAVHAVGVLHRDIKPSNVLMEGRSPVLIDFGLARVADDPRLTHTGWLLGTPGYLAPEILHGEDATAAADVHSWAATVAFAGTGAAPFGRGPSMAIMDRVRRGEHDLTGVDLRLQSLLDDCLDPDPRARPSLPEVREWLATLAPHQAADGAPGARTDDPPTVPLVLASLSPAALAAAAEAAETTEVVPAAGPSGVAAPSEAGADAPTVVTPLPTARPTTPYTRVEPAPPVSPVVPLPPTDTAADTAAETVADTVAGPVPVPTAAAAAYAGSQPRTFFDDWEDDGWVPEVSEHAGTMERLRRSMLVVGGGLAAAAAVAAVPYVAVTVLVLLAWLLRSMSLAGSAVGQRRELRGRKWYDGVLLLMGAPWYVVSGLPGTLLLALWSLGVGAAIALVCYAAASSLPVTLAMVGAAFAFGLWWGPGGSRVRGPVQRMTRPVARRPVPWALSMLVVLAVAAGVGALAQSGPSWAPDTQRPFSDVELPSWAR